MNFSERYSYSQLKNIQQIESIDQDLMNSLWNVIYESFIGLFVEESRYDYIPKDMKPLFTIIWKDYYKLSLSDFPTTISSLIEYTNQQFFSGAWFAVYNFIEFLANINVYVIENELSPKNLIHLRRVLRIFPD
jgi:hypothetical protein